jgi:biotin transporter BioY
MPHLFVNRPRAFGLKLPPQEVLAHFKWELINTIFYQIGGVLLLAGSILFLPQYEDKANIGAWLFIIASVFYVTVSAHECWEIYNAPHDASALDTLAASSYLVGAVCFIIGSILFLPDIEDFLAGGYMFIIGSILFVLGAFVNSIQIFDSPTRSSALYANLTAVSYVIGSTMYLTGSIPYLWTFNDPNDSEIIYRYLAEQFIMGSILFIIGGTFNIHRAMLIVNHYVEGATSTPEAAVEESYQDDK